MVKFSGTSNNGPLCAMATSCSSASGEITWRNYNQTLIKTQTPLHPPPPTHSGYLQLTIKLALVIVPVSNFTSINGQAGNPLQRNERKNF